LASREARGALFPVIGAILWTLRPTVARCTARHLGKHGVLGPILPHLLGGANLGVLGPTFADPGSELDPPDSGCRIWAHFRVVFRFVSVVFGWLRWLRDRSPGSRGGSGPGRRMGQFLTWSPSILWAAGRIRMHVQSFTAPGGGARPIIARLGRCIFAERTCASTGPLVHRQSPP